MFVNATCFTFYPTPNCLKEVKMDNNKSEFGQTIAIALRSSLQLSVRKIFGPKLSRPKNAFFRKTFFQ